MIARLPERLTPAEADPRGHLSGVDWLSRIASILLTAALVASVAFAFRMATVTREVAGRVDAGRMVTSYLRTAQYANVNIDCRRRAKRSSLIASQRPRLSRLWIRCEH
jgi:hypothetical protein